MMRNNFKEMIRAVSPISDQEFDDAMPYFKDKILRKGEFFVKEGTVCRYLAYVNKGFLRTFYVNEKGEEVTYCFCSDNNFETSFKSFVSQTTSALSIQALEDSALLAVEYHDLQKLYSESKAWEKIGRLFSENEYLKMEEHACNITNETAKEKYLRLINNHPHILQKSPLLYISSYLGITPRHLSRLRKEIISGHMSGGIR